MSNVRYTRAAISQDGGSFRRDAALLCALLSGDSGRVDAQLAQRDPSEPWGDLPLYRAAVLGGSCDAVALLAAAGVPADVAGISSLALFPVPLLRLVEEEMGARAAAELGSAPAPGDLAASRGRLDLLAALRQAGVDPLGTGVRSNGSFMRGYRVCNLLSRACAATLAGCDTNPSEAVAAAVRALDFLLACAVHEHCLIKGWALLCSALRDLREQQEEEQQPQQQEEEQQPQQQEEEQQRQQQQGVPFHEEEEEGERFSAAARQLLRWPMQQEREQGHFQRLYRSSALCRVLQTAAAAGEEEVVVHFAAQLRKFAVVPLWLGQQLLCDALEAPAEGGFFPRLVLRLAAGGGGSTGWQRLCTAARDAFLHTALRLAQRSRVEVLQVVLEGMQLAGKPLTIALINAAAAAGDLAVLQAVLSSGCLLPQPAASPFSFPNASNEYYDALREDYWALDSLQCSRDIKERYRSCPIWSALVQATDLYHPPSDTFDWVDMRTLRVVELLAAAGYRPTVYSQLRIVPAVFPYRQRPVERWDPATRDPGIDVEGRHRYLYMAANPENNQWTPETHSRFPLSFRSVVRTLLLVAHRGSSTHPGTSPPAGPSGKRRRAAQGALAALGAVAQVQPILHDMILAQAAYPLSAWAGLYC